MKKMVYKVCCVALLFSIAYATKGFAESVIFEKESVGNIDYVCNNQVGQNGNVNNEEITMVKDERGFSFYLDELLNVYKKKNIEYARDFFISKGFKNKTKNETYRFTITYDGKVIKIVAKMEGETNPFPFEWKDFLTNEQFKSQFTDLGQFWRTDYRKIGFPIISEALDFSASPCMGYFYIGEQVKKQ